MFVSFSVYITYLPFTVNINKKVSLPARRVSDAIVTFKDFQTFNKDYISPTDIL
jgi:hypothetical protein